jgi:hypothetical protein
MFSEIWMLWRKTMWVIEDELILVNETDFVMVTLLVLGRHLGLLRGQRLLAPSSSIANSRATPIPLLCRASPSEFCRGFAEIHIESDFA